MTIEEQISALRPYNHCRACEHFIRVNFEGVKNVMNRQGFCILGRLEGDFSLYYSCSAAECMAYCFSESHGIIELAERSLDDSERTFVNTTNDKRSKNYKLIEPLIAKTREFIQGTQEKHAGLASIMAMREIELTAHKWYWENHKKDYFDVYNMVSLQKSDYSKFVAQFSVELHNRFCKCDGIVYTGDFK